MPCLITTRRRWPPLLLLVGLLAAERLRGMGYRVDYLQVDGRSGSAHNAVQIAERLRGIDLEAGKDIVLVGYSKGASDGLTFLATYPELARKVTALVSIAGSINGSPLADRYAGLYNFLLARYSFDTCGYGDGQVIESLKRNVRMSRLVELPLPRHVAT